MAVEPKLAEWRAAGLIDDATLEKIRTFERRTNKPYALHVVGGLGGLAVVLGIISIIASNWADIPRGVKLAVDLLLVGGLARGVWRLDGEGKAWAREMVLLLFWGMVLASVALIGQVYHLGGKPWQALLAWSLMTFPAMALFGRSGFVALATLLALNGSVGTALGQWADRIHSGNEYLVATLLLTVGGLVPLLHIRLGHSAWLSNVRPAWASVARGLGWATVLVISGGTQHAWYGNIHTSGWEYQAFVTALVPVAAVTAWLCVNAATFLDNPTSTQLLSWRVLLGFSLAAGVAPLLVDHGHLGPLAALSFMAFLLVVAWYAYQHAHVWLFNVATAFLAIRLLVIFGEVFGSLLTTGVGLIFGGLTILGMAWLWLRQTRTLRAEIRQREGA